MKNRNRFGRLRATMQRHSDQRFDRAILRMNEDLVESLEQMARGEGRVVRPRRPGFWRQLVRALVRDW